MNIKKKEMPATKQSKESLNLYNYAIDITHVRSTVYILLFFHIYNYFIGFFGFLVDYITYLDDGLCISLLLRRKVKLMGKWSSWEILHSSTMNLGPIFFCRIKLVISLLDPCLDSSRTRQATRFWNFIFVVIALNIDNYFEVGSHIKNKKRRN